MIKLSKEELLERLEQLDTDATLLFDNEDKYYVYISGGCALILAGYTSRATSDIDVIDASRVLYSLFSKYQMNGHIAAFINSFPFNFEDRVELILKGEKIDFYSVSLEDVVISKLCAFRPSDKDDLKAVAKYVNWDKLELLATNEDELRTLKMNDSHYLFFTHAYNEYVEEYKP